MSSTATVPHDGEPVRLTQLRVDPAAPVTVINLATERVWLSDDSTAPSGQGVPLEGGTPTRWEAVGELYAVADSANTADAELVVSDAIQGYQPSPYATAVYAALQIAAAGVPINQAAVTLYNKQLSIAAGLGWAGDIGNAQTLVVTIAPKSNDATNQLYVVKVIWSDEAGDTTAVDQFLVGSSVDFQQPVTARLIVKGPRVAVNITMSDGATAPVAKLLVIGLTQAIPRDDIAATSTIVNQSTGPSPHGVDGPILWTNQGFGDSIPGGGGQLKVLALSGARSKIACIIGGTAAPIGKMQFDLYIRSSFPGFIPDILIGSFTNSTTSSGGGPNLPTMQEFDVPFGASFYGVVTNNDTGARTPVITVIDVSP